MSTLRHFLRAAVGGAGPATVPGFTLGPAFTMLPLSTVDFDTAGRFNPGTHIYTVPAEGVWDIKATLRFPDAGATGLNVGMGVDTSNSDSPAFEWDHAWTGTYRKTFAYIGTRRFQVGDPVRLFAYADDATPREILSASLSLTYLGS